MFSTHGPVDDYNWPTKRQTRYEYFKRQYFKKGKRGI